MPRSARQAPGGMVFHVLNRGVGRMALLEKPEETAAELEALRLSVSRGRPFGEETWAKRTMLRLGLENTARPRARPRKEKASDRA